MNKPMSPWSGRFLISLSLSLLLSACEDHTPAPVLGTLERDRLELVAEASEPLLELSVREGQQVHAGQLLARLDPRRQQVLLERAAAEVEQARQNLMEMQHGPRTQDIERVRSQLAGAIARERTASAEYRRTQDIVERGLQSQSALDRARAERDSASAEMRALQAQLDELLAGTRDEQVAQAQARWLAAQAEYDRLQLDLERLSIHAPVAGYIDSLPYRVGERPPVGAPVVVMLDGSRLFARIYLPVDLRTHVKTGDPAEIVLNGYKTDDGSLSNHHNGAATSLHQGQVRWIASDAAYTPFYALNRYDRGHLVYLAEIDLNANDNAQLAVGVPVSVYFPSAVTASGS